MKYFEDHVSGLENFPGHSIKIVVSTGASCVLTPDDLLQPSLARCVSGVRPREVSSPVSDVRVPWPEAW